MRVQRRLRQAATAGHVSNDRSPALYKIGTGEDIEKATKPSMFDLKVGPLAS